MTHYITHHCTLNCIHCNTFNNFNFKGSVDWLAERDNYKNWSEKVTSDNIGVLGGEPLLHPNLEQILRDISDWLAKKCTGVIVTCLDPLYGLRVRSRGSVAAKSGGIFRDFLVSTKFRTMIVYGAAANIILGALI